MKTTYGTPKGILMYPDNYQCFAQTFVTDDSTAVTEDGKTLIKAGTIWPSNDDTAKGVVFYDVDITNGTGAGAVLFEGSILVPRLPAEPSESAKTALPRITFFEGKE